MPETAAKIAWVRENTKQIKLKLNKRTDADIIEWIDKQASKQGAIKKAIRKQIEEAEPVI